MKNKQKGGEVITSGGFGCIFEPSLKCENTNIRENNKISKLMLKKNAEDEYNQIVKYDDMLKSIPNYEKYFLIKNITLCKPEQLTKDDLIGYHKKCKALKKKDIKIKNINKSLDKLLSINMPNGGVDIDNYIKNNFVSISLNNSLIDLLVNGIIPMNKQHVYHCDIKDGNVLVNVSDTRLETRLIDWGLSFVWNGSEKGIPKKIYRRPFQYNVPFSSILFNKDLIELYDNFLQKNNNPTYFEIREFVINYIFIWNEIRGPGHLSVINNFNKKLIINDLTAIKNDKIKEHLIEYDFTYYYIIEYLSKILEKYSKNGKLELMMYFNDIFIKNIDIWGFVMIYVVMYEYVYKNYKVLNESQRIFMEKIKYIIIHYLYESPINVIDISSLINELTSLNEVIDIMTESVGGLNNRENVKTSIKTQRMKSKSRTMKSRTMKSRTMKSKSRRR